MSLRRNAIETPEARRSWCQRFIVGLTMGDAGRNWAQVKGCWYLHQIAAMEREIYGDIVSEYVRDHVEGPPETPRELIPGRQPPPRLIRGCWEHLSEVTYR
jgi:hypothetical protein